MSQPGPPHRAALWPWLTERPSLSASDCEYAVDQDSLREVVSLLDWVADEKLLSLWPVVTLWEVLVPCETVSASDCVSLSDWVVDAEVPDVLLVLYDQPLEATVPTACVWLAPQFTPVLTPLPTDAPWVTPWDAPSVCVAETPEARLSETPWLWLWPPP